MKTLIALAFAASVVACGGGDQTSCADEPPVIVVTAVSASGATTEYRFTTGTQLQRAVEVQQDNPASQVSVHQESACDVSHH